MQAFTGVQKSSQIYRLGAFLFAEGAPGGTTSNWSKKDSPDLGLTRKI